MTDAERCEVCGQRVRVEGDTTRYYVGLEEERIKHLENENLHLKSALKQCFDKTRDGNVQSIVSEVLLNFTPETNKLSRERDADMAVIEAANKLNITRTGYGYRTDCNDTYAVRDLLEALANREKIYGERK